METVLISGGTGLVGKHLVKLFTEKGYQVRILTRNKSRKLPAGQYYWDYEKKELDPDALKGVDYIIHLAGAGIADGRWSPKRKIEIIDSRVKTASFLFEKVKELDVKVKAFISASGLGYYGAYTNDHIYDEEDEMGKDFLAEVCGAWENEANKFKSLGIRTVVLRTGIVLSGKGGALSKFSTAIKMGVGSAIGSGKQYMPWIHIDDLCRIYLWAIENDSMQGAYNAASPEHTTNKELLKTLAGVLGKPFWAPNVPSFVLKLLFGEMADILLNGVRVSSNKLLSTGFKFRQSNLKKALTDLTG